MHHKSRNLESPFHEFYLFFIFSFSRFFSFLAFYFSFFFKYLPSFHFSHNFLLSLLSISIYIFSFSSLPALLISFFCFLSSTSPSYFFFILFPIFSYLSIFSKHNSSQYHDPSLFPHKGFRLPHTFPFLIRPPQIHQTLSLVTSADDEVINITSRRLSSKRTNFFTPLCAPPTLLANPPTHLPTHPPTHPSTLSSTRTFTHPSTQSFIHLSIHLSTHP